MNYIEKIIEEINKEIVLEDHGHKFDTIIRKIKIQQNTEMVMVK